MSLSVKGFKLSNGNIVRYDYSSLDNIVTDTTLSKYDTAADAGAVGEALYELNNALDDITIEDMPNGLKYENSILYLTADDVIIGNGVEIKGGSGGGGSDNNAVLTVTNTTGWLASTVSQPICTLSVNWSSFEDDIQTGDGILTIRINNVQKLTKSISQGDVSVSIGQYLISGTNNVKLTVSDVYGNSRTINYTVNYFTFILSSNFDGTQIFRNSITYYYVATGAGSKVMHFIVDGVEIGTDVIASSGRQNNYLLGLLSNGTHTLDAYFTVTVNDQSIESNHLYYDLICADSVADGTYIAVPYNDFVVDQYSTCLIPYTIYCTSSETVDATLSVNGTVVSELAKVDRTQHFWSFKAVTYGTTVLTIESNGTVKTITLTVNQSEMDIHAVVPDLALYLSSSGRSNNESHPENWSYGNINSTLSNFLFDTDGWQIDNDGNACLRVRGNNRIYIPYMLFGSDCTDTGKTIELEFTTRDTINPEAIILSCMSGATDEKPGIGIELTPQKATLYSNLDSVYTVFKEDEHVRITFVIDKYADGALMIIYINGIASGCKQYLYSEAVKDSFEQLSPVGITIGSNDATLDIYTIRVYNNNLTRYQVLDNWIADTQNIDDMLDRYNRNNIFENDKIVISKLPSNLPYMIIYGPSLPQSKGDKKTVSIEFEDPTGNHPNFTADNVNIDVQGTSSAGYARKNYKCKFNGGFVINNEPVSKYKMNKDAIATKTFTFKADVASSEGANNVELVRLYEDFSPYKTEPQQSNPSIRQGIDGFPMVIFHHDGETTKFVGKYNFNNDKGTPEVFGFEDGDESWEIKNNTDLPTLFKSGDFSNWTSSFEGRYPDEYDNPSNLQEFVSWVASTDTEAATNTALSSSVTYDNVTYTTDSPEYRLAKFKAELGNHANITALAYYYAFTDLFLMIDSRAKNAFPSFFGDGKWLILPYDMDTAIGINNEGELVFSPYLEDDDQVEGTDVYNGQKSVLWINLKRCFFKQIASVYDSVRVAGLTYAEVESRFEDHQSRWPEAVFNEDSWYKYIDPLLNPENGATPTSEYLGMMLGSKEQQRKWWLYNRFHYIDNKYQTSAIALSTNRIYFRAYARADLTLTPAHDTYLVAKYGSAQVQVKADKDVPTLVPCTLDNMNDTECYIYGCENVKSLGDMVDFNVGTITVTQASNLQYIKLGDAVKQNTRLTTIDLSACNKLKVVDLRNCINLSGVIDVSNCFGLEELYLTGTQVSAVSLPKGGILKKLHLPAVTVLTIINQPYIEEFVYDGDYANINTLRLENAGAVNDELINMVLSMADNSVVRLVGVDLTIDNMPTAYDFFRKLRVASGLSSRGEIVHDSYITGKLHLTNCIDSFCSRFVTYYSNSGFTITYASTINASSIGVTTPKAWNTMFSIDKTAITEVICAKYHVADGTEDEKVTIKTHSTYGTTYGYRYGTRIILANNEFGCIFGIDDTQSGMFQGMTSLTHVDVSYVFYFSQPNSQINLNFPVSLFGSCTSLTQIDGLKSFFSIYRLRHAALALRMTFAYNPIVNFDTGFLYGLIDSQTTSFGCPSSYWNSHVFTASSATKVIDMSTSGKWNLSTVVGGYFFNGCTNLESLVSWYADGKMYSNTFLGCPALTHCIFRTDTGIDFTTNNTRLQVPSWDYASLSSIIECAVDKSGEETPVTMTLNQNTFALLDDQLITLATSKGYTLASA